MKYLHNTLAIVLCIAICAPEQPGRAQQSAQDSTARKPVSRPEYRMSELHGNERILHALNRFTFGPRPGDLEAIRSMGLERWFDEQLHPESLDETDLNARLAQYPAMDWSTAQLLYYLPSNGVIRQVVNGKINTPTDPVTRAIYEDQIARIQAKRLNNKSEQGVATHPQTSSPMSGASAAMDVNSEATENPNPMASYTANQGQMSTSAPSLDQRNPSNDAIESIIALAPRQRIARLCSMEPDHFENFIKSLRPVQRQALNAGLNPSERQTVAALENPERLVAQELIATRLTRDIYSNAQLQEVMTDFWLNHFNVYLRKNEQMPYYLVSYERDTVRPHALGRFEDLLEAVAHSPAMLFYLDNAQSIGPNSLAANRAKRATEREFNAQKKSLREGLNENYARELMELHTVGVNGGYTQTDVIQAARILTGWTVDRPLYDAEFTFNRNRHDPGSKKVMNQKFKEDGELEGTELLHMLATRPATAQFISRKLAVRFVSDDPPQPLIDRMARTFLSSGGDISAVLRTLFHSPEFWSPGTYRAKIKTPLEFVASAARAANANITNMQSIENNLRQMGMPTYGAIPPTGYKWDAVDWLSSGALVDRMNFAMNLAAGRLPGIGVSWAPIPGAKGSSAGVNIVELAPTPETEEARLESILIPGGASETTRAAALKQFAAQSAASTVTPISAVMGQNRAPKANALERQDQIIAGLLIGSPDFQRR